MCSVPALESFGDFGWRSVQAGLGLAGLGQNQSLYLLRGLTLNKALHVVVVVVWSQSHVPLFVTPWTVAHQASLSVGFPRQE